ncbi:MAG: nitroreductase family protein [Candidatus Nealsonbacteria bacterium]|nr:nitroreductase family protein [Candidatus Nealsonbacteria bacterium]
MANEHEPQNPTIDALLSRASCRDFVDKEIPPDVLRRVLEAGIHAPTAGNLQPVSIIKVVRPETKQKLAELNGGQKCVADAAVDLVFCIDWHRLARWAELEAAPFVGTRSFRHFWFSIQDTIICAQTVCTAAESVGLGAVYVGMVVESITETRELLQLPEGVVPVVLLSLGYPATKSKPARKLGVDLIVHDETYRDPDDAELVAAMDAKYEGHCLEATQPRVARIAEVCHRIHGAEFSQACFERIQQRGVINQAQIYFGLLYSADEALACNDKLFASIARAGCEWFERCLPPEDRGA